MIELPVMVGKPIPATTPTATEVYAMYEPYEVDTIHAGRLTARIYHDDDAISPFSDYDPPCDIIITRSHRNEYSHLSTARLSDFADIFIPYYDNIWYRETPSGDEVEIGDDDDAIAHIVRTTGAVAESYSIRGCSQSEWFDVVLIMDRETIKREVSQYNRKGRPAPRHRVSERGIEHYDHDLKAWRSGNDTRTLPAIVTQSDREKAREMLDSFAHTIRQYMQDDVYCIVIEDDEGETVDSLSSVYGIEYAREEAQGMIASAKREHVAYQYPDLESWEDPEYQTA